MPVTLTYPGVYVEEIPSGVRTITGVATSITAFLGRALQGPTDEPITINSFGDFERQFGGLHVDYPMSYAVRDFYLNGGSQAIIVRLYRADGSGETGGGAGAIGSTGDEGKAILTVDGLTLSAISPGEWGSKLRATIDVEVSDEVREQFGLSENDYIFNLAIHLGNASERFLNLTVTDNARRIDRVLNEESRWIGAKWSDIDNALSAPGSKALSKTKATAEKYKELLEAEKEWRKDPKNKEDAYKAAKKAYETAKLNGDDVTEAEKELAAAKEELAKAEGVSPQVSADIAGAKSKLTKANEALEKTKKSMGGSNGQKTLDSLTYKGSKDQKKGLYALEKADQFNLLCIPSDTREGDTPNDVYQYAMKYCADRRALLIVDPPANWGKIKETAAQTARNGLSGLGLTGPEARNAALYFPRVLQKDPLREGQLDTFVPCGIIAGRIAYTDATRGVWKAPAGLDASLNGIQGLQVNLTDAENGMLNPLGINCLRSFPVNGQVIWGARTLRGADQLADEWKYIPVRRTALFIEESLYRGTQWVVFEPNDEPLWSQIRLNVGSFMHNLFRQGAFQGSSPKEAYFVKCDKETTPQNDIDRGIVNIVVGFAPLKPAEFVVIKLQQIAGELEV